MSFRAQSRNLTSKTRCLRFGRHDNKARRYDNVANRTTTQSSIRQYSRAQRCHFERNGVISNTILSFRAQSRNLTSKTRCLHFGRHDNKASRYDNVANRTTTQSGIRQYSRAQRCHFERNGVISNTILSFRAQSRNLTSKTRCLHFGRHDNIDNRMNTILSFRAQSRNLTSKSRCLRFGRHDKTLSARQ